MASFLRRTHAATIPTRRAFQAGVFFALGAALVVHGVGICRPMLLYDDFQILAASWSWQQTIDNLWTPANEHTMPLGRLSTWLLVQLAGGPTGLPIVAALQGLLAVLIGMSLVYLFITRELGQALYGLIGMALFGVTSQYIEAVRWFAASFSLLALMTLLFALLAAQRWRQSRSLFHLGVSVFCCALAPCWFASGVLAGPICCLYLLPIYGDDPLQRQGSKYTTCASSLSRLSRFAVAALPALGSLLFLAVSLPRNAERIMHLEHYYGKTAVESFHLDRGLVYTGRSLVDNLFLGTFGVSGLNCPPLLVIPALGLLAGVAWLWWQWSPNRRLPAVGLGLILLSYVLTYSARSEWWSYEQVSKWSRYELIPHLGLVLFFCGGLPRFQGWLLPGREVGTSIAEGDAASSEMQRQFWLTCLVLTRLCEFLIVSQLPRSVAASYYYDARQAADLQRVAEVDSRCRAHRISAALARQVLPPFRIVSSGTRGDGWEFLRGSDDPVALDPVEARRLLQEDPAQP